MVTCDAEHDPELFAAARLGLGALGRPHRGRRCSASPTFALSAVETPLPLAEVLDGIDDLADGNDHFEFFWFPTPTWR